MSVEEDTAEDQDGDFDAQCLPVRWRGGETIRRAVREVRSDHAVEGEEGHVAAPCCNDERCSRFDHPHPSTKCLSLRARRITYADARVEG